MDTKECIGYEGSVRYDAPLIGVCWEAFDIETGKSPVTRMCISTNQESKRLSIQVHFTGVSDLEQARAFTDGQVAKVVDRLAYHLNMYIKEPTYAGGCITTLYSDGSAIPHEMPIAFVGFKGVSDDWYKFDAERTRELQQQVGQPCPVSDSNCGLYRSLMASQDTVAKFLSLYLVLMSYHDDSPAKVDKFIIGCDKNVLKGLTKPPQGKNPAWTEETVYSRLRNQIGHTRNKPLQETETEMWVQMNGLMALVKRCFEKYG